MSLIYQSTWKFIQSYSWFIWNKRKKQFRKKNPANLISNFIIMNEKSQYVIEKLFRKKIKNEKFKYQIKWKKYEEITWKFKNEFLKNISEMIRKFNERKTKNIKIRLFDSSNEWNVYLITENYFETK